MNLYEKSSEVNSELFLYREWESNPHALMDTWPSTMPVYQFQHPGVYYLNKMKKVKQTA